MRKITAGLLLILGMLMFAPSSSVNAGGSFKNALEAAKYLKDEMGKALKYGSDALKEAKKLPGYKEANAWNEFIDGLNKKAAIVDTMIQLAISDSGLLYGKAGKEAFAEVFADHVMEHLSGTRAQFPMATRQFDTITPAQREAIIRNGLKDQHINLTSAEYANMKRVLTEWGRNVYDALQNIDKGKANEAHEKISKQGNLNIKRGDGKK